MDVSLDIRVLICYFRLEFEGASLDETVQAGLVGSNQSESSGV